MGKFIITEEEKKTIRSLYEIIGGSMTIDMSNSPKARITREKAEFLNKYYNINLSSSKTGNWQDKDYNEYLKKFLEEKQIPVWVCKKGDGYCADDGSQDGEVTTKEMDALTQAMAQQSNQEEKLNTTNDSTYDYKLSNGKYYYSLKGQNKWVEAKGRGLDAIKTKIKF